jgi:hypothetical protein
LSVTPSKRAQVRGHAGFAGVRIGLRPMMKRPWCMSVIASLQEQVGICACLCLFERLYGPDNLRDFCFYRELTFI